MKLIRTFIYAVSIALLATACGNDGKEDNGGKTPADGNLILTADRTAICADGADFVTFTVTVKGADGTVTDITGEAEIYLSSTDDLLDSDRFSTDVKGEYAFYAAYGLSISDEVTVSAVPVIPEIPSDPREDGKSFSHRMLLIDHTGATCPNCPLMLNALKEVEENAAYNTKFHLVASHSYYDGVNDAAYAPAAKTLSSMFNSGSYPELTFNLTNVSTGHGVSDICTQIDALTKDSVPSGIAMSVEAADGEVFANAEFKFCKSGKYRIGAWLLEDDIFARQSGATEEWHHYHNNALRLMYGEKQNEMIFGTQLGTVEADTKVSHLFRFRLEDTWKAENCKVLAFITEASGDVYDIVTCTVCPVGEEISYEYK